MALSVKSSFSQSALKQFQESALHQRGGVAEVGDCRIAKLRVDIVVPGVEPVPVWARTTVNIGTGHDAASAEDLAIIGIAEDGDEAMFPSNNTCSIGDTREQKRYRTVRIARTGSGTDGPTSSSTYNAGLEIDYDENTGVITRWYYWNFDSSTVDGSTSTNDYEEELTLDTSNGDGSYSTTGSIVVENAPYRSTVESAAYAVDQGWSTGSATLTFVATETGYTYDIDINVSGVVTQTRDVTCTFELSNPKTFSEALGEANTLLASAITLTNVKRGKSFDWDVDAYQNPASPSSSPLLWDFPWGDSAHIFWKCPVWNTSGSALLWERSIGGYDTPSQEPYRGADGMNPTFERRCYLSVYGLWGEKYPYSDWYYPGVPTPPGFNHMYGALVSVSKLFLRDTGGESWDDDDMRILVTRYSDPSPRSTVPIYGSIDDGVDPDPSGSMYCREHYKHETIPAPVSFVTSWEEVFGEWGVAYVFTKCAYPENPELFKCIRADTTTESADTTEHRADEEPG